MKKITFLFIAGVSLFATNAFTADLDSEKDKMFKSIGEVFNNTALGTCPKDMSATYCGDRSHIRTCRSLFSEFECDWDTVKVKMGIKNYQPERKNEKEDAKCKNMAKGLTNIKCCPLKFSRTQDIGDKYIYMVVTEYNLPYIKCFSE